MTFLRLGDAGGQDTGERAARGRTVGRPALAALASLTVRSSTISFKPKKLFVPLALYRYSLALFDFRSHGCPVHGLAQREARMLRFPAARSPWAPTGRPSNFKRGGRSPVARTHPASGGGRLYAGSAVAFSGRRAAPAPCSPAPAPWRRRVDRERHEPGWEASMMFTAVRCG